MNFTKYISFFHDGSLNKIEYKNDILHLYMSSSEVLSEENEENIRLDKENCIRGELVIRNIRSITINKQLFLDKLKMLHEDADILDFYLTGDGVELGINWNNPEMLDDFTTILIQAEEVFWDDEMNQVHLNLSGLRSGKYR